jgi:hypothetical protein
VREEGQLQILTVRLRRLPVSPPVASVAAGRRERANGDVHQWGDERGFDRGLNILIYGGFLAKMKRYLILAT